MGQFTSVYLMMKILILLSVLSLCTSQNVQSSWLRSAILRHKRPLLRTLIQDDFFDSTEDDPELPTLDFKLDNLASSIDRALDLATELTERLTTSEPKSVSGEGTGEKKLEIQSRKNIEFARQTASEPKPISFETRSKSVSEEATGEKELEMFEIQGRNTHGIALELTKLGPKYSNRGTLISKRFKKVLKNAKTRGAIGVVEILVIVEMIGDLIVDLIVDVIEIIVDHHVEIIGRITEVEVGDLLQEMIMEQ